MGAEETFFYKSNRLQQIRGFYYTVQRGSVSEAAAKMGVQQSAVSMQIKALERDLSVTLFERNGPHMTLTQEGQQLYEIVLPHIEGIDSLPGIFAGKREEAARHRLTAAANQTSLNYLMPYLAGQCKRAFPGLNLTIKTMDREPAYEMLRRDEIEAYVGAVEEISHEFEFHEIISHEAILIARRDHPLITAKRFKMADISDYPVVRCPPEFITVPLFEDLMESYRVRLYVMLERGDWEVFKSFVAYSDAFSMVSRLCYDPARDREVGVRGLRAFLPDLRYGIVTKKGKHRTPALEAMIEAGRTYG